MIMKVRNMRMEVMSTDWNQIQVSSKIVL